MSQIRIQDYPLRWRILARIRRFFRPSLRRPLPVFLTPIFPNFQLSIELVISKHVRNVSESRFFRKAFQ